MEQKTTDTIWYMCGYIDDDAILAEVSSHSFYMTIDPLFMTFHIAFDDPCDATEFVIKYSSYIYHRTEQSREAWDKFLARDKEARKHCRRANKHKPLLRDIFKAITKYIISVIHTLTRRNTK